MRRLSRCTAGTCLALSAAFWAAAGGADQLDFDTWDFPGEQASLEKYQGRDALRLGSARATQHEVKLLDGTIELDLALSGQRSFVSLEFRMQSEDEYEEVYFRPHKSALPDALQYSPVYKRESNWQLYHGPGGTASAPLPADTWIHVKLVLEGRHAALFVGDMSEPQLVVLRLAREPAAGFLGLRGFIPPGSPAPYAAYFANVVALPGKIDYDFSDVLAKTPPVAETPPGVVKSWELSRPFVPQEGAVTTIPADIASAAWTAVGTEPSGLVVLGRHLARPDDSRRSAVLARLRLRAAQASPRRLDLGYSDEVSVFWNGRLLFYADASYSYDEPRREGLIGLDQTALFLPFQAGENELVLAIADSFGGWGLMARLADAAGIEILDPAP